MLPIARFFVALALLACMGAARAEDLCARSFAGGRAPALTNAKLGARTTALCYQAFAILYSGVSRTPLYAAERLTRASVASARRVDRSDAFHEERRLPADDRSELADYLRSGFDRGHMAPAGDMPTPQAQAQSFTLANVLPQNRTSNRSLWAPMEESVRRLATIQGEIFVVSGPIFAGEAAQRINGRVLVPTQLYKAVYDPVSGQTAAYLTGNDAKGVWRAVSIAELRQIAGLDVFPGLSEAAKARAMALPEPREFSRDGGPSGRPQAQDTFRDRAKAEANRILHRMWRDLMRSIF